MNDEVRAPAGERHELELTVWDVPSAIGAGERFRVAVGARCSAGCDLAGRELVISDQEGAQVGTVKLGHEVCPGTEALYFAVVEAKAPPDIGAHQWEATMAGWNAEPPHGPGSFPLNVRVVGAPDCEVTVRAIDRENQAPIQGASVVMHPYRAVTDANGVARIRVARGQYDILVSGSHYAAVCTSVKVTADLVTSAELDADLSADEVLE